MCSPIPSMLVRSTPAIRCNWVAKGLSFLLLGRLQGIDLRLGLGLELAGRQFCQGLGNLLIALANLLLVKFVSVQRPLFGLLLTSRFSLRTVLSAIRVSDPAKPGPGPKVPCDDVHGPLTDNSDATAHP